jgi:4-aminobutyrate aminotransferase/(S)-3-amino-2-methylpropionate transaminase
MCGTCANETSFKAAFMHFQHLKRGGKLPTEEQMNSCMLNEEPGTPKLAIMSFKGAFHGRLFGSLSLTHSKAVHKVDIPAFEWPAAPFPLLKYPLNNYEKENRAEEDRCLTEVARILDKNPIPVAALVVEPIQGEGGDNHASPYFFQQLREITKKRAVAFIVDEVQTGAGATGKFWAHEHWNLSSPPDMVTFAKKMQASGFYHNIEYRPSAPYRNFNTWMGDPVRALQLDTTLKEIKSKKLIENTAITGQYLNEGLLDIQSKYPEHVSRVRGAGTYTAFDLATIPQRDALVSSLRSKGVNSGGCGEKSLRLRPMLIFQPSHAKIFLDTLDQALAEMK